jgi:hypothetical protein
MCRHAMAGPGSTPANRYRSLERSMGEKRLLTLFRVAANHVGKGYYSAFFKLHPSVCFWKSHNFFMSRPLAT